tara:strand:- start:333 stop:596 length:264 start_codon:yes stop_codon:yes gene_type:complete
MTNQRIIKEFLFDLENTGNSNNLINTGDQLISHDLVIAEKVPTTTVGKFETVIYNWNDSYIPSIIREDIRIVKEQASKVGYWGFIVI